MAVTELNYTCDRLNMQTWTICFSTNRA